MSTVIIGAIGSGYFGYLLAGGYKAGNDFFTFLNNLNYVLQHPVGNYFSEYSLIGIIGCILIFEMVLLFQMATQKNYMKGKEFGTAKYANPHQVNCEIADLNNSPEDINNLLAYNKGLFGKNNVKVVNTRNRILTEHVYMTLDTKHTGLNNNILIIGGSGAGKTFRFVKPNLMTCSSSFICTDPKGEIMQSSAGFLKSKGYKIRVLNLLNEDGMKKSTRYNPFRYLQSDADVLKLATNFMSNTKKKDSSGGGDQFWEDSAQGLLNALIFYTWYEGVEINGKIHHDFKGVVNLLRKAEFKENPQTMQKEDSELDIMFNELEERERFEKENDPSRKDHQAIIYYNQVMRGAGDTVRSIIQTLNSRMGCLQNETVLELLTDDEMDIPNIGEEKTAVFCVIPDNDKTFNFVIGMLYSQMFQILYYQADFVHGGRLPIHVTFMLDEFANVALPDDYCSLLSTMRSREISSIIIIQNMAQIKALFKDTWGTIPGNCDTLIYLGGNEQETHKYISEMLGKKTIDKSTNGITRGKQGSSSENYDVLGRELLLPEEVRKVDGSKCIVFIRGFDPIFDDKIKTPLQPFWKEMCKKQDTYEFDGRLERYERLREMGIDPSNTENQLSFGKIYTDTELNLLIKKDEIAEHEYKKEQNVSRKLGIKEPKILEKKVIRLSLGQLLNLPDDVEITDLDFNISHLTDEIIEKNQDICEEKINEYMDTLIDDIEVTENEESLYEESLDEEIKISRVKNNCKSIQTSNIAQKLYVQLNNLGFDKEQIKAVYEIVHYAPDTNLDVILKLFTVDMTAEDIKDYIYAFYRQ